MRTENSLSTNPLASTQASLHGVRGRGAALVIVVLLLALSAVLAALVIFNPFNWLAQRSTNFTEERFLSIQVGTDIGQVIALLGEPLEIQKVSPIHDCPGCKAYCFLGEPPIWVIEFREAWVIIDPAGKVVERYIYSEA